MKLVSWNVAGFRACLKKGFADFFETVDADVFCLQEVKALAHEFDFAPAGYYSYLNPAEKKGYSGTLVYTKTEPLSVQYGMGVPEHDHEGRIITLEYEQFYLVSVYVPNAKSDLSRLVYRQQWEDDFLKYVKALEKEKPVVICGDLNVAHTEIDIKNAKANVGNAGFTPEERAKFTNLLASGFVDTFRQLYPETIKYSWWTYLHNARANNAGWRIDYFLVSNGMKAQIVDAQIYSEIMGSDHCPVGLELK